jgi:hypothetical protein
MPHITEIEVINIALETARPVDLEKTRGDQRLERLSIAHGGGHAPAVPPTLQAPREGGRRPLASGDPQPLARLSPGTLGECSGRGWLTHFGYLGRVTGSESNQMPTAPTSMMTQASISRHHCRRPRHLRETAASLISRTKTEQGVVLW